MLEFTRKIEKNFREFSLKGKIKDYQKERRVLEMNLRNTLAKDFCGKTLKEHLEYLKELDERADKLFQDLKTPSSADTKTEARQDLNGILKELTEMIEKSYIYIKNNDLKKMFFNIEESEWKIEKRLSENFLSEEKRKEYKELVTWAKEKGQICNPASKAWEIDFAAFQKASDLVKEKEQELIPWKLRFAWSKEEYEEGRKLFNWLKSNTGLSLGIHEQMQEKWHEMEEQTERVGRRRNQNEKALSDYDKLLESLCALQSEILSKLSWESQINYRKYQIEDYNRIFLDKINDLTEQQKKGFIDIYVDFVEFNQQAEQPGVCMNKEIHDSYAFFVKGLKACLNERRMPNLPSYGSQNNHE